MEKLDIIKYIMKTPDNTNPAIIDSMLDELISSQPNPITWIEWSGDITGRAKIDMGDGDNFTYKVSKTILTAEDLNNMHLVTYDDGDRYVGTLSSEEATDLDGAILFNGEFACVSGKAGEYHNEDLTITIPEDGTYFPIMDVDYYVNMLLKNNGIN